MGNSSLAVKTRPATRDVLAKFANNQRLIKLFENLAQDVGTTIPGAIDQTQDDSESVRALAIMVQAIAARALELALQAADGPPAAQQVSMLDEAPVQPQQVVEAIAVGGIYITVDSTDPALTLRYGVWAMVSGRFLVGYSAGDADFGTPGGVGGVKTISVQDHAHHTHNVTSAVSVADHPNHTHTFTSSANGAAHLVTQDLVAGVAPGGTTDGVSATLAHTVSNGTVASTNESATLVHLDPVSGTNFFKTLPPFLVVYFWQRTA